VLGDLVIALFPEIFGRELGLFEFGERAAKNLPEAGHVGHVEFEWESSISRVKRELMRRMIAV